MKRFSRLILFMLLISVLLLSGCTYNPPEGHTKKHHTYEEVLAYAKTLDPNATVSEEYTDTSLYECKWKVREWSAVINGTECHVSSVGDWVWNGGFAAGEFSLQYYYIDTDYDYYILQAIVAEKQPEWYMEPDSITNGSYDNIASRYNPNFVISVQTSYSDERPLTDEELEIVWQEALEIHEEYTKYSIRNKDHFQVPAPGRFYSYATEEYIIKMSTASIRDFSQEGKDEFFKEYHERWALTESEPTETD